MVGQTLWRCGFAFAFSLKIRRSAPQRRWRLRSCLRTRFGRGLVKSTITHVNNDVYELSFVEGGEALRGTGAHPLYSLDRDDWVRIRDLQVGERLQTANGAVTVEALEKVRGLHRVYNLEVEGDHEYLEVASKKWTVSLISESLRVCCYLEIDRADRSERRMPAPRIVEPIDIRRDGRLRRADRRPCSSINHRLLERPEKALSDGVIKTSASRSRRCPRAYTPQSVAMGIAGVLGAAVRMDDETGFWAS